MATIQPVREVLDQVVLGRATEREKAIAIHDYVREKVKFGFNKYFDAGTPEYTLACGVGHCNPKSRLMVALLRSSGLEAYQHFVVIPKEILKGAIPASQYWMIPPQLSHSYVEVKVEGAWCEMDSFIVDTPMLKGAQRLLAREHRPLGYGIRADSVNTWDGMTNAFAQLDSRLLIEDHGRIEDLEAYFNDKRYRNKAFGLSFNTIFKLMGNFGVAPINNNIERIRKA